jgi:hypothetical protein
MAGIGPVEIGAREIYDTVLELRDAVHELRAEVRQDTTRGADHEGRLSALERARWPLPSLAVVVAIAALLLPLLMAKR